MQTRSLFDAMSGADFVMIDGVVFAAGYVRVPRRVHLADDVVVEARNGEMEIELTRAETRAPKAWARAFSA